MVIVRFSRVWWAGLGMGHPLVRWSLQMMTQDEGMTAQLQGDHEGGRDSTTKLGGMWDFSCCLMSSKRFLPWSPWPLCKSSMRFLSVRSVGKTKQNLVDDANGLDFLLDISRCHAA